MRCAPIACALLFTSSAAAQTMVPPGNVTTQTWSDTSQPYMLSGDVTIPAGQVLTISAGVTVIAADADITMGGDSTQMVELRVEGELRIEGTAAAMVTLRSVTAGTTTQWYGIDARPQSTVHVQYAALQHALTPLLGNDATITVRNSTIEPSASDAMRVTQGTLVVEDSRISGGFHGLRANRADATVRRTVFHDTRSIVIEATTSGTLVIEHNTIYRPDRSGRVFVLNGRQITATISNNIIVGFRDVFVLSGPPSAPNSSHNVIWNHIDIGVSFAWTFRENPLFVDEANRDFRITSNSPARDSASDGTSIGAFQYAGDPTVGVQGHLHTDTTWTGTVDVLGDLTIRPDVTLTIAPGTTVRFAAGADSMAAGQEAGLTELRVDGTLIADGGPSSRIAFQTASQFPSRGDWYGIRVLRNAQGATVEYADISFARQGVHSSGSNVHLAFIETSFHERFGIWIDEGAATVDAVVAHDNDWDGLLIANADATVTNVLSYQNRRGIVAASQDAAHTITILHATVVDNDSEGIDGIGHASQMRLDLNMQNTVVANNGGVGVDDTGVVRWSLSNNNVFGHSTDYRGVSPGPSSISVDPMFVNAMGRDYALTTASMSVDSGAASSVAHDVEGTPRPLGAGPDMGAFERNGSGNRFPIADAGPDQTGQTTVAVTFDGSGSVDPDGTIASYAWDFGDGTNGSGANPTHTYPAAGAYTVILTVTDNLGATDTDVTSVTITAGMVDTAPPAIVHTPIANGRPEGIAITISADITDDDSVANATLFYRAAGQASFTSLPMTGAGTYTAVIPATTIVPNAVEYYVFADDPAGNSATHPAGAPGSFHTFTVIRNFGLSPGDLVVTEIMADPTGDESLREWFEVHNRTGAVIDASGIGFSDDGQDAFTVNTPVMIPAQGYVVFGRSSNMANNGGVQVDYVYSGLRLSNTEDELVIVAGPTVIDRVAYNQVYPLSEGSALSLDPAGLNATANDTPNGWCAASSLLTGGDRGTPGAPNDACSGPPDTTPPAIVHTPIADGQQQGVPARVVASVTDASGVAAVMVHYRTTGGMFTAVAATLNGTYQADIPANVITTAGVDYYISATDTAGNQAFDPPGAPAMFHHFDVTNADTSGPSINHTKISDGQPANIAVDIEAVVTDASGVDAVMLHYRNSGALTSVALSAGANSSYTGQIPASSVVRPQVEYYLSATDTLQNASELPSAAAPFVFTVVDVDLTGPEITHTPIPDGVARGRAVRVDARITDASGVDEARLFFRRDGTFDSVRMQVSGDDYSAEIPSDATGVATVEYYIEASDASPAQNVSRSPGTAPVMTHRFMTSDSGTDDAPPVIEHTPVKNGQTPGVPIVITATITDDVAVTEAELQIRIAGDSTFTVQSLLHEVGTSSYQATIPADFVTLEGAEYVLRAADGAGNQTITQLFTFTAEDPNNRGGVPDSGCDCNTTTPGTLALWLLLPLLMRRRR